MEANNGTGNPRKFTRCMEVGDWLHHSICHAMIISIGLVIYHFLIVLFSVLYDFT